MGLINKYFRFSLVGVVNLSLKITITIILSNFYSPLISYVITHVIVFITSYLMHSIYTFEYKINKETSGRFLLFSIILKFIDILTFSIIDYYTSNIIFTVFLTSIIFHCVRFFSFKRYIFY